MAGLIHVFDLLDKPPQIPQQGLCALFGSDRFLQHRALEHVLRLVLTDDYEDVPVARFGSESSWADVVDEINTISLFGSGGPRLAVVDEADSFVNAHRERLEDLVSTSPAGLLILLVSKWPSNTRLFKAMEKSLALQVDCGPPRRGKKKKDVDLDRVTQWLNKHARTQYKLKLEKDAAPLLFELARESFGIVEQGLVKLNLLLEENATSQPSRSSRSWEDGKLNPPGT